MGRTFNLKNTTRTKRGLKFAVFMLKHFFKNFCQPKFCDKNVPVICFDPRFKKIMRRIF